MMLLQIATAVIVVIIVALATATIGTTHLSLVLQDNTEGNGNTEQQTAADPPTSMNTEPEERLQLQATELRDTQPSLSNVRKSQTQRRVEHQSNSMAELRDTQPSLSNVRQSQTQRRARVEHQSNSIAVYPSASNSVQTLQDQPSASSAAEGPATEGLCMFGPFTINQKTELVQKRKMPGEMDVPTYSRFKKVPRPYKRAKITPGLHTLKEVRKGCHLVTKSQMSFIASNRPKNPKLSDEEIAEIDQKAESVMKMVVKHGGGGKANPVPLLNFMIYRIAIDGPAVFENENFANYGPHVNLTPALLRDKITPLISDMLEMCKDGGMCVGESTGFLADTLVRRLRDYQDEAKWPSAYDEDNVEMHDSEKHGDVAGDDEHSLSGLGAMDYDIFPMV